MMNEGQADEKREVYKVEREQREVNHVQNFKWEENHAELFIFWSSTKGNKNLSARDDQYSKKWKWTHSTPWTVFHLATTNSVAFSPLCTIHTLKAQR